MDDTRRRFLTLTTLGLALATPVSALAQPPRILRGQSPTEAAAPGHEVVASGQLSPELRHFATALDIRETARHGALTLLWLGGPTIAPSPPILTLEEGRASGQLTITERAQATVPDLVVENRGKTHVLMLAGEILIGGKQDRVLREDILLPPRSGPRHVGVFCVEQGRWSGTSQSFAPQGILAAPSLRSRLMDKAEQREVWREVDRAARAAGSPPAAGSSYQHVYQAPEVRRQVQDAERAIEPARVAGALGAAVFVGSRFLGIDAFRDPGLFGREWGKLVRAYAVEATREPDTSADLDALRKRTFQNLGGIANAAGTAHGNAGVGRLFEFRVDGARGAALVAEAQVVHLALL